MFAPSCSFENAYKKLTASEVNEAKRTSYRTVFNEIDGIVLNFTNINQYP